MSLKELLKKAKTSKEVHDEMLEPAKKYNQDLGYSFADCWGNSEKLRRKQWISVADLNLELNKLKRKTGKQWAWYFYKELGYRIVEDGETELALKKAMNKIFELSEEKNPIKVLHKSMKRNDRILRSLNNGSKKVRFREGREGLI
jgi:hypothetical protein